VFSRNGLIVVVVVLIAVVVFSYVAFKTAETPSSAATPTTTSSSVGPLSQEAMVAQGKVLFQQYRCNVCHTTEGGNAAGPTMKGLAGSQVKINDGTTVVADTNYLRESILNPDTKIVAGYGPSVMSAALDPFSQQIQQDNHVADIVAYIESLK